MAKYLTFACSSVSWHGTLCTMVENWLCCKSVSGVTSVVITDRDGVVLTASMCSVLPLEEQSFEQTLLEAKSERFLLAHVSFYLLL